MAGHAPLLFSLVLILGFLTGSFSVTSPADVAALLALKGSFQNPSSLATWNSGSDPCNKWMGVLCDLGDTDGNNQRVTMLSLTTQNLAGYIDPQLGSLSGLTYIDFSENAALGGEIPETIGNLIQLETLNLQRCNFSGPLPNGLSNLKNLAYFIVNNNQLSGPLLSNFSQLSNMYFFDITDNQFTGPIPVNPGINNWSSIGHLHLSENYFTTLPRELGGLNTLRHLLMDNNALVDVALPPEYSNMSQLLVLRLNNNKLTGGIPASYGQMKNITQLSLSNCSLTGAIPAFSEAVHLANLDLSLNSLSGPFPPEIGTSLLDLVTIDLSGNLLSQTLPAALTNLSSLQYIDAGNNLLVGEIPYLHQVDLPNSTLYEIAFMNNKLNGTVQSGLIDNSSISVLLAGNPLCITNDYPLVCQVAASPLGSWDSSDLPEAKTCKAKLCTSGKYASIPVAEEMGQCNCVDVVSLYMILLAPPFYSFTNEIFKEFRSDLISKFKENNVTLTTYQILALTVAETSNTSQQGMQLIFFPPDLAPFSVQSAMNISSLLISQKIQLSPKFGPYSVYNLSSPGLTNTVVESKGSSSTSVVIGTTVGAALLVLLIAAVVIFFLARKLRKQKQELSRPFYNSWGTNFTDVSLEGLNLQGIKYFTIEQLAKATNNFSSIIGEGGYGSVYLGTLEGGEQAAIKRAKPDSHQGSAEFRNEIELLSAVRHRNLVVLLGFCKERGEQLLVYEYIPNGNLFEQLNGKVPGASPMTWEQRMDILVGSARGLAYLHTDIQPPIIHRDIKSSNILIDDRYQAKVADFGLSKSVPESDDVDGGVDTRVKGTVGYLDPEYFLTDRLTEKSDVYSFGVVMMEVMTARKPIQGGEHIVRHVNSLLKQFVAIETLVDKALGPFPIEGAHRIIKLAIRCCHENPTKRPHMLEIVKELEVIRSNKGDTDSAELALPVKGTLEWASTISSRSTAPLTISDSGSVGDSLMSVAPPQPLLMDYSGTFVQSDVMAK